MASDDEKILTEPSYEEMTTEEAVTNGEADNVVLGVHVTDQMTTEEAVTNGEADNVVLDVQVTDQMTTEEVVTNGEADNVVLDVQVTDQMTTEEVVTNGEADNVVLDVHVTDHLEVAMASAEITNPNPSSPLLIEGTYAVPIEAGNLVSIDKESVSLSVADVLPNSYTEIKDKETDKDVIVVEIMEIDKPLDDSNTLDTLEENADVKEILQIFPFVCGICSEKFDKIATFYAHFKIHKEYQSALHICETGNGEKDSDSFDMNELFTCGICNSGFPSMCLLHDHMLKEEMIADYRYQNHVVMPVYGRLVKSTDITNTADEKNKSEKSKGSRAKFKIVKEKSKPKKGQDISDDKESDTEEENKPKRQKVDNDIDSGGLIEKGRDGNESMPATVTTPGGHTYGTRRQSALKASKTEETGGKTNSKQRKSSPGGPPTKDKEEKLKSLNNNTPEKKSPCVTVYSKSAAATVPKVLERKFEISTRRKTYTTTKVIGGKVEVRKADGQPNKAKGRPVEVKEVEAKQVESKEVKDVEAKQVESKEVKEVEAKQVESKEVKDVEAKQVEAKEGETSDLDPLASGLVVPDEEEKDTVETLIETVANQLLEISQSVVNNDDVKDKPATEDQAVQASELDETSDGNQEQFYLMKLENDTDLDKETQQSVYRKRRLKRVKEKFVSCEDCGKLIPRKGLQRHRVVHLNARNYPCDLCGKAYKSRSHLRDHTRIVHAARAFKCVVCGKEFKTAKAVEKHAALHVRRSEVDPRTGEALINTADKYVPINNTSTSGDEYKEEKVACTICDKVVSKNSIKNHLLLHSTIRNHICDICGAAFKLASHLREHTNFVHLKVKKWKCDICQSTFKNNAQLRNHKNQHLNTKDPFYSEEVVQQLQKEEKERRMRKRHAMPKTAVCDLCGKVVLCKRMTRHKDIHKQTKDFPCDICGKKFVSSRYVRDHKLKVHTEVRTFCDICGQFFKGKNYLEKHRQIHGPRDKSCDICGKGFTTDFYLRMHKQTHSDKKGFKCDLCPAAFSTKPKLTVHMTDKHDIGEKRPCKYCDMMFPSRQRARFHERRMHEGFEEKKKSKRKRLHIKQEPMTVGEEYHVIVSQDLSTDGGDPQIKILTENFEASEEVTSVELIEAATKSEIQETVTHAQLLDAVIQSGSQEEIVQGEAGEEIVQHVLEIPDTAEQVCALVVYPDGSYRLVNPSEIGPDVKVVAEVATG